MNIINNKTVLLKTTVIVKLNCIISDLKVKSGMGDVYSFNYNYNFNLKTI